MGRSSRPARLHMLASTLIVRFLPKSSPLLCSSLQSSLETVDYATERLSFGLKYVPGHGHGQKKLHYAFTVIQKYLVLKYFVVSNY